MTSHAENLCFIAIFYCLLSRVPSLLLESSRSARRSIPARATSRRPLQQAGRRLSPLTEGDITMWDIGCIAASVAFFILAIAYTTGCDRLGTKESK